jgi:hypothetical protein
MVSVGHVFLLVWSVVITNVLLYHRPVVLAVEMPVQWYAMLLVPLNVPGRNAGMMAVAGVAVTVLPDLLAIIMINVLPIVTVPRRQHRH